MTNADRPANPMLNKAHCQRCNDYTFIFCQIGKERVCAECFQEQIRVFQIDKKKAKIADATLAAMEDTDD